MTRSAALHVLAAYVLLFQAIFVGLPLPAAASGVLPQILCSHEGTGGSHGPLPLQHSSDCCLLGCCGALSHAALSSPAVADAAAPATIRLALERPPNLIGTLERPEKFPRQTRGPPEMI